MTKTASNMLALGTLAPHFSLFDVVSQRMYALVDDPRIQATVIFFICNHCPYVKHINPELSALASDYQTKGVRFIAINANDISSYPDDSPENMRLVAQKEKYCFPYLFDETQEVAAAYQAACTPDFYVFDAQLKLVYRGQLDDSRPGNSLPVTGESIRTALDLTLKQLPVSAVQKPSLGCNIKWKK